MKIKPLSKRNLGLLTLLVFLTGCVANQDSLTAALPSSESSQEIVQETNVISYGRYRLVELRATDEQQNILAQIIDISIPIIRPETVSTVSVHNALRYVLLNSGYTLCEDAEISIFQELELPLAHRHIGPMTLEQALKTLTGSKWQMNIDDHARTICFSHVEHQEIFTNKE